MERERERDRDIDLDIGIDIDMDICVYLCLYKFIDIGIDARICFPQQKVEKMGFHQAKLRVNHIQW